MTQPSEAASPPAPGDARAAVSEILRKEADLAALQARPAPRRYDYRPAILMALVAMSASLWLTELPFLRGAEPEGPDAAQRTAGARFSLYLQAQRVVQYRIDHGRLPQSIQDVDEVVEGVSYTRLSDDLFRLSLVTADGSFTFRSDDSPESFLGGSLQLLGIGRERS
jgi:hypothetical protein